MFDPSSFVNPTPLAHADASRDVLAREADRELLTTDLLILNHGQVTNATPELPLLIPTGHLSLDIFNVHRLPLHGGSSAVIVIANSNFCSRDNSFSLSTLVSSSSLITEPNFSECGYRTATAGSDVVQSGRPIFDDFFQHLWPYIGNNTANVVFQMVKRLWLIRIDQ
ncbi:hypothetical protein TNCV_1334991 [Trichonephila clavipes]|nr:hypothetical protein TNCV_1334991 [Trichonephila clavipes]